MKPTVKELKDFLAQEVARYGLDYDKFYYTIEHESSFDPDPTGNVLCRGISQYILSTWLSNCSKTDERLNPYKSISCMAKMWSEGNAYQWDAYCFKFYDEKCIKLRGLYPNLK